MRKWDAIAGLWSPLSRGLPLKLIDVAFLALEHAKKRSILGIRSLPADGQLLVTVVFASYNFGIAATYRPRWVERVIGASFYSTHAHVLSRTFFGVHSPCYWLPCSTFPGLFSDVLHHRANKPQRVCVALFDHEVSHKCAIVQLCAVVLLTG